jgi:2-amino-4-hydroxy-6-hydroxymethyldihydropteridine diphosphokinase
LSQRCFVALGANLGDPVRDRHGRHRRPAPLPDTTFLAASSLYRTAPVGLKHQPDFINAVVELVAVVRRRRLCSTMLFAIEGSLRPPAQREERAAHAGPRPAAVRRRGQRRSLN